MKGIKGYYVRDFLLRNKRGFTLMEILIAFVILFSVTVMLINTNPSKATLTEKVTEIERDYIADMKVITKALALNGSRDNYELNLDFHIPLADLNKSENSEYNYYIVNLYDSKNNSLKELASGAEILNKVIVGGIDISIDSNSKIGEYKVKLNKKVYTKTDLKSTRIDTTDTGVNFGVVGSLVPLGNLNYMIYNQKLLNHMIEDKLDNTFDFLIPKTLNNYEVLNYEEDFK